MPKTNPLTVAMRSVEAKPAPSESAGRSHGESGTKLVGGHFGTKLVGGHFPEPVHRQLRVLAAQEGCTIHSLLSEALNGLFRSRQLPPIA